jgi:hypothetical protein
MAKFTPITFTNLNNETSFVNQLNTNFSTLSTLLDTMVSRNGTSPNTMTADLDVNSQDILNANATYTQTLYIGGVEVAPADVAAVPVGEMAVGTVSAPGLPFEGDANTGWFQDTVDTAALSIGGSEVFRATSTGIAITGDVTATDDMSCDRITAASMTITTGGLVISAGGLNVTGTVTLPAFAIPSASTATTQSASDNSTKVATTAYVDGAISALPGAVTTTKVYATRITTDQTVADATATTIIFNSEAYDTKTEYDNTTGVFTVATTGYYFVDASASLTTSTDLGAAKYFRLQIAINGTPTYYSSESPTPQSTTYMPTASISRLIYLTAGDTVAVQAYQTTTKTKSVAQTSATRTTYLSIYRVS